MMRKTPDCPKCGEDELCLYRAMDEMCLACIECGWRTSQPLIAGQDLDEAIAEAVRAAQPDGPHGFYAGTNPPYVPDATEGSD